MTAISASWRYELFRERAPDGRPRSPPDEHRALATSLRAARRRSWTYRLNVAGASNPSRNGGGHGVRGFVSTGFGRVQDVVYVALGVLLAVSAIAVLVHGGIDLVRVASKGMDVRAIVNLLDRVLLALMIVELLYTVQVSFREHTLVAEPFLLVALIASVRRILVITAEFGAQSRPEEGMFRQVLWELGLLTMLIVVLVSSLAVLRKHVS